MSWIRISDDFTERQEFADQHVHGRAQIRRMQEHHAQPVVGADIVLTAPRHFHQDTGQTAGFPHVILACFVPFSGGLLALAHFW